MRYIYWAIPDILAGRPGPCGIDWDLREIKEAGFGAILSLHNSPVGLNDIYKYGLEHKLLPLPNTVPPSIDDFYTYQQFLPEALSFIHRNVTAGIPMIVHCHAGNDRTGVALVTYLYAFEKINPSEAIRKLRIVRPSILSADGYESMVYRLLASQNSCTA
jgi:protein-tyrosine phosphatase